VIVEELLRKMEAEGRSPVTIKKAKWLLGFASRVSATPQGACAKFIDPAALPLRPERNVSNSIATIRIRLAHALAPRLPRCPCCHNRFMTQ
jgi:hypothetical protein